MTMALCFHCGHAKFGAICPCPECGVTSTGDMNLDIAFSDHHLSLKTIEAFGEVVRAIRKVCQEDDVCFWSFIRFVSVNHAEILGVELELKMQAKCDDVLSRANPPAVIVEEHKLPRFPSEDLEQED